MSKDEVRKLTPEQQESFGALEARRVRSRQQLLERARRGMTIGAGLFTGLAAGLAVLCIAFPRALPIAIIGVIGLVTYHAARLHRRLDAVIELQNEATTRATDPGNSKSAG